MKTMRLRRVSHLVVSSVLASCGGSGGETHGGVVTIPPAASTSSGPQQVELLRPGAMDVVPTDSNARMRFVSMAEIVEALAPPDPNRAALYGIGRASFWLQRVKGPDVDEACNGVLKGRCETFGDARFVSLAKDGTVTVGMLADLDPARTHDSMIARARAELTSPTDGVWFVDGAVAKFPEARVLTDDTPMVPAEEMPIATIAPHIARIRALSGDARERAILALGLSAKERAALRASFATDMFPMLMRGRMTSLARGWLAEIVTVPQGGSCGSSSGYARIVVLGSNVIVDAQVQGVSRPCKGRRPPGWELDASRADSSLARFFEDAASLEAASIDAFELVARELEAFGAPAELVLRARAAARDEIRHAAVMSERAGSAQTRTSASLEIRTPFEAALDNAVEGCVNESFAAIVARFQSRAIRDEDLAHEFATIADDECAHGDLAWDIAAWLEPRLSPDERARVRAAREHAKRVLVAQAFQASGTPNDTIARETLGLPTHAQANALARAFVASL